MRIYTIFNIPLLIPWKFFYDVETGPRNAVEIRSRTCQPGRCDREKGDRFRSKDNLDASLSGIFEEKFSIKIHEEKGEKRSLDSKVLDKGTKSRLVAGNIGTLFRAGSIQDVQREPLGQRERIERCAVDNPSG